MKIYLARSHIEMKRSGIEMAGSEIKKSQADLHSKM